jgi:aminoglycoside phosphotransferase (APT) family kinase protein
VPGAGAPVAGRLIAGGKSNLTYELDDGHQVWILRRPPLGHVLATAHDMAREYRVMSALRDTAVPVPRTYALCPDDSVLGAPFYVMAKADGTTYRSAADLAALGPDRVHAMSAALVDTLADLHAVDPDLVGLSDFGRPEGFLARQVSRWKKQLDASHSRDVPGAEELYLRLSDAVPAQSAPGIVHGDYRLDNALFDCPPAAQGGLQCRLTAVLDWEMATLGDPVTDLALLVLYQRLHDVPGGSTITDVAAAPGFLTEPEVIARYAQRSGRDLSHFGFYLALASFKLATIAEGIYFRHLHGLTLGPGFDNIGTSTAPLIAAGLAALTAD